MKARRCRLCVYISARYPGSHCSPWDHVESTSAHPRAEPSNAQPNTHSNDCIDSDEGADTQVVYGYLHIGVFIWAQSHLWLALYGAWPGQSMFDFTAPIYFKLNMGLSKQLPYFSAAHSLTQIIWCIWHLALQRDALHLLRSCSSLQLQLRTWPRGSLL